MKKQILTCVFAFALVLPTLCLADQEPPAQAPEVTPSEVDHSLQELNDILTQERAIPHFENSQLAGYRKVDDSTADLSNGDVVRRIDGQRSENPEHAFQIISTGVVTNHQIELRSDHEEISVNKEEERPE